MTDTKHTPPYSPLPWRTESLDGTIDLVTAVIAANGEVVCDNEPYCPRAVHAHNAAFIVRACNAHDALVEALEGFERLRDLWLPLTANEEHYEEVRALHSARNGMLAALALAKGE